MMHSIALADVLRNTRFFDRILDVRSPLEFEESHIPHAHNTPVLDNEQRHIVGTAYKQNPFEAKILGASLICQNISSLLKTIQDFIHPSMKILIYCARGGQRSASLSLILSEIGYQVYRLEGGYKHYRSFVAASLTKKPDLSFLTLCGPTGSGKSEIIAQCSYSIDIEGLASHLGSSFGGIKGKQPSAKMFQNALFDALCHIQNTADKIALVECESKKIGQLILPTPFVNAYRDGIKIYIDSPIQTRIQRIVQEYGEMSVDFFEQAMEKIKPYMTRNAWQACKEAFSREDKTQCAEILLLEYYDKTYKQIPYDFIIKHHNTSDTIKQIDHIKQNFHQYLNDHKR